MDTQRSNLITQDGAVTLDGFEYEGLCATCEHAPTCMYAREPERPVLECEEFACFETEADSTAPRRISLAVHVPAEDQGDELTAKGLCGNCENRATCTFVKPEGGVWQCEEYR
jgi:hypothetical protein